MRRDLAPLRENWDQDDLVQEVYLKALAKLDTFCGRSSLKTWVVAVAKRHLLTMARSAAIRPRANEDALLAEAPVPDEDRREHLRGSTTGLLGWLRKNPDQVEQGWEILNLLLWTHGDHDRVALNMTLHTGRPWTPQKVRAVIRRIKRTPRGLALCDALGLITDVEEEEYRGSDC